MLVQGDRHPGGGLRGGGQGPDALGVPDCWFNRTDGKKVDQVDRGLPVPGHLRVRARATADEILKRWSRSFLTVTEEIKFVDDGARRTAGSARTRR